MIDRNGPTRIILIHSGKYRYAEVEIDEAIHLAGDNNSGKTTLVATLQFLYIDSERAFKFTRENDVTRRYYFKNEFSYILFECMTANGYMVVGARGTSALGTGTYERFIYKGSYRKHDYFEKNGQVKASDDIKLALSEKDYTVVKPTQLRAALTGTEVRTGFNLNLLPIRNRDGYGKFRNIYKNLLELSNVGQEEVKESLIHICYSEFRTKGAIALQDSFSEGFERIKRQKQEIESIRKVEKFIRECSVIYEDRENNRAEIIVGYATIIELFRKLESDNIQKIQKFEDQLELREVEKGLEEEKFTELTEKLDGVKHDLGGVGRDLKRLEEGQELFKDYLPKFEKAQIEGLKNQLEDIQFKLRSLDSESETVVSGRLQENRSELGDLQNRADNFEHTLVNILRKQFSEDELSSVFALINQGLLGEDTQNGTIDITDHVGLGNRIGEVLKRVENDWYSDDTITIRITQSLKPKLSRYTDIEEIEKQITLKKSQIKNDLEILKTAEELQKYLEQKKAKSKELDERAERLIRYNQFKKEEGKIETLVSEKERLIKSRERLIEEQDQVSRKMSVINSAIESINKLITETKDGEKNIRSAIRNLSPPDPNWQVPEDYEIIEDELEELLRDHEKFTLEEEKLSESLTKGLEYIESTLYGSSAHESEKELLDKLVQDLQDLDKQEEAVGTLWKGIMTALHTDMRDLLEDVNAVKNRVTRINRSLKKIKISDLVSLEIQVEENKSLANLIKDIIKRSSATDLLALADISRSAEPIKELQDRFLRQGKIDIKDLFSLKFKVVKVDESIEVHTKLKDVESTGTMITIKVLVNLILMKGLFDTGRKIRIPFYLDEISSLDDNNAVAITQKAEELGFTPVIASPQPSYIVKKIYTLQTGNKKGLYVDDRNLLVIEER